MKGRVELLFPDEIEYVQKHQPAACILAHLSRNDRPVFGELHDMVNGCIGERVTQKRLKQYVKTMIMRALITEVFAQDLEFRFILSPIGEAVYKSVRRDNNHMAGAAHS